MLVSAHLKEKLDEYLKQFGGKVKLIRNTEREGLIQTRSIGARHSSGDVIIFLDAHCEVNINWLPPLLAPIRQNRFCALLTNFRILFLKSSEALLKNVYWNQRLCVIYTHVEQYALLHSFRPKSFFIHQINSTASENWTKFSQSLYSMEK